MKQVLNFLKSEKVYFYLTLLIAITFFTPKVALSNIAIVLFIIVWLLKGDFKNKIETKDKQFIFVFLLLYGSFVIGTLYTENLKGALKLLMDRYPIVFFPLIFATIGKFTVKRTIQFKYAFILFTSLAIIYCYSRILFKWAESGDPFISIITGEGYGYSYITQYIALHPTYFSYFILISLVFLETIIQNIKSVRNKIVGVLVSLLFVLVLIHIATKIALIALFFLILFFIVKSLFRKKIILSLALTSVLIIGVITAFQFDATVKRFKVAVNMFIPQKGITQNVAGYRLFTTKIFKKEFAKHPIFGVGFANGNHYLDKQFDEMGFPHMKGKNYHNQYFQILIELGLFGFLILLLNLIIPLRLSIIKKNHEYFLFLAFTMLFFTVENILRLHKGVASYAFFNALFVFTLSNMQKTSK